MIPAAIYERDARARKVLRITMSIDAALHAWGKNPDSWEAYQIVETMGSPAWGCAASCAGVPVPSQTTKNEVLNAYLVRAIKAEGPLYAAAGAQR